MGFCIRPLGVFIVGDAECRQLDTDMRNANRDARTDRAWAHASDDSPSGFAQAVGSVTGFLGGVVGSDPVSQLLGGGLLTGEPTAASPIDPLLLVGAVALVGVAVYVSNRRT